MEIFADIAVAFYIGFTLWFIFYLAISIYNFEREKKPKLGLYLVPMIGLNNSKLPVKRYQGPFEVQIIDSTKTHYKIIFKDKEIRNLCTDSPWVDKDFVQVIR